jgi:hypothetical protein
MMTASDSLNSFLTGNGLVHSPKETAAKRKQVNRVTTRFVALAFPTMLSPPCFPRPAKSNES